MPKLISATFLGCLLLTACSTSESSTERNEENFVALVRAAGGSMAELYDDEELISQGDELCAIAESDFESMRELKELAISMADAATTDKNAAEFLSVVATVADQTLC